MIRIYWEVFLMFNIVTKQGSLYADISSIKTETQTRVGFKAYEKSKVSIDYDLRTNESKLQKIKMREIENDG